MVFAGRLNRTNPEPEKAEPPPVETSETGTTPRFDTTSSYRPKL